MIRYVAQLDQISPAMCSPYWADQYHLVISIEVEQFIWRLFLVLQLATTKHYLKVLPIWFVPGFLFPYHCASVAGIYSLAAANRMGLMIIALIALLWSQCWVKLLRINLKLQAKNIYYNRAVFALLGSIANFCLMERWRVM